MRATDTMSVPVPIVPRTWVLPPMSRLLGPAVPRGGHGSDTRHVTPAGGASPATLTTIGECSRHALPPLLAPAPLGGGSTGVEARKLPGEANVHDQIRNELREFIGDNYLFGDHDRLPDDEASLLEEGIVDSTGVLELIEFLEDHFGIVVGESETVFENLGSVGGLTRFVASKTLAGQPVG